jgi:hypothetical protein
MSNELQNEDCLGKHLLVVGDVNTGKTTLCRQWLIRLCQQGWGERTVLIDMAPHIPMALARARGIVGVGGNLVPPHASGVLELRTNLEAPRLSSTSQAQAMEKAQRNVAAIDVLLAQLPSDGRDILFINDVSLYLQAGFASELLKRISKAGLTTLVVNGYWGDRLGGGELTLREAAEMRLLRQSFAQAGKVLELTHCYRSY